MQNFYVAFTLRYLSCFNQISTIKALNESLQYIAMATNHANFLISYDASESEKSYLSIDAWLAQVQEYKHWDSLHTSVSLKILFFVISGSNISWKYFVINKNFVIRTKTRFFSDQKFFINCFDNWAVWKIQCISDGGKEAARMLLLGNTNGAVHKYQ